LAVGRPLYKRDRNNFGPNIGLAWDVFGNGRTSLRAGYSVAYANDNNINTVYSSISQNAGGMWREDHSLNAASSSLLSRPGTSSALLLMPFPGRCGNT